MADLHKVLVQVQVQLLLVELKLLDKALVLLKHLVEKLQVLAQVQDKQALEVLKLLVQDKVQQQLREMELLRVRALVPDRLVMAEQVQQDRELVVHKQREVKLKELVQVPDRQLMVLGEQAQQARELVVHPLQVQEKLQELVQVQDKQLMVEQVQMARELEVHRQLEVKLKVLEQEAVQPMEGLVVHLQAARVQVVLQPKALEKLKELVQVQDRHLMAEQVQMARELVQLKHQEDKHKVLEQEVVQPMEVLEEHLLADKGLEVLQHQALEKLQDLVQVQDKQALGVQVLVARAQVLLVPKVMGPLRAQEQVVELHQVEANESYES